jgi:stearoyl-CoA desaturase (delta-9 desaturase)
MTGVESKKITGLMAGEKPSRPPPSWKLGNFKVNKISTGIITIPPVLILGAVLAGVEFQFNTFLVFLAFYALNGFGITAGYHRMFAHRAYGGNQLLQWAMAFFGAGAWQGSAKWWCRNHRIHHRYIDTDLDPYNATRGFFYTHVGWMLMEQDYENLGNIDISDLNASKILNIQHKNYLSFATVSGIMLPTLICGLGWGDWLGGYFYAALLKMVIVHHTTFFINSLAHTDLMGAKQNFSDQHTSHDSLFCALLTLGEGYHNFHHEFAQDYRNGIRWFDWDPTKWLIRGLEIAGLARNLVRTPNSVIHRNMVALQHKKHQDAADALRGKLNVMDQKVRTPNFYTWADIERRVDNGEKLVVVGDYVLDMLKPMPIGAGYTHANKDVLWYKSHPGGRKLLDMYVGKDATEAMSGGIYKHSQGAFNMLQHLRVANLKRGE